ncbi:hypothetical protein RUND412_004820 [Rhizina undulata]
MGADTPRTKPRKKTVIDAYDSDRIKETTFNILEQLVEHYTAKQQSPPDFQRISDKLGIPEKIDPSGTIDPIAAEGAIKTVHKWLSTSGNQGRLLLVDNYENADLSVLVKLIPSCDWGSVIVTTRFPNLRRFGECVEVEEIGSEEGLTLLLKSAGKLKQNLDESELDVAEEISFHDYQHKLDRVMKASFRKNVSEVGLPSGKASVLTTWEISIQELDENARHLLELCAYLSNEDIPEELFYRGEEIVDWIMEDEDALEEAMESLFNLSLAKRKHSTDSFWIHPLIHAWARHRNDVTMQQQNARDAISLVAYAIATPGNATYARSPGDWTFERRILSHLGVCVKHSSEFSSGLRASRVLQEAEKLYGRVITVYEKTFGMDHPGTLTTLDKMAMIFFRQERYNEALDLWQRLKATHEKALGKDHPDTLMMSVVNNIASILRDHGWHNEALELIQRSLTMHEKALGKEHPETLTIVNNVASIFFDQGRHHEALELFQRSLAGRVKALGKDHPDILATLENIASIFRAQGQHNEAFELFQRSLAGYEKAFGKEHPDTLHAAKEMAVISFLQERYNEALEYIQMILVWNEKELGKDHEDTLMTTNLMVLIFRNQGRYNEALELYQRSLAVREKELGKDHPDTLTTVNSMASLFRDQGLCNKALELFQRVLAGRENALGKGHPDTLKTANIIASIIELKETDAGARIS